MTTVEKHPTLSLPEVAIQPLETVDATVPVLGSKSYTNRFLVMAALSGQPSQLQNALVAQDTAVLSRALTAFGHVEITVDEEDATFTLVPTGTPMKAPTGEVDLRAAGTPIRLLMAMAAMAEGRTILTGTARMQERPMGHLLEALNQLGVPAEALRDNGNPPIAIEGPSWQGGSARIDGSVSSQFATSLLVAAPYARQDVNITVLNGLVSKPYVDMTLAAMESQGVQTDRIGYEHFSVRAGQRYRGGDLLVEPDASGMSYFLGIAAVLGGRVRIPGISKDSVQGDVGLTDALVRMGCRVTPDQRAIVLEGGPLIGIDIDMADMPDVAPTLAVVAAYAKGRTHITGIGNLRLKECDRIDAVSTELGKMGIEVHTTADSMTIVGGEPRGAVIDTYDDHRIAMSFAVAGLRTPGVVIRDPACVTKSFPQFWNRIDDLRKARS